MNMKNYGTEMNRKRKGTIRNSKTLQCPSLTDPGRTTEKDGRKEAAGWSRKVLKNKIRSSHSSGSSFSDKAHLSPSESYCGVNLRRVSDNSKLTLGELPNIVSMAELQTDAFDRAARLVSKSEFSFGMVDDDWRK